MGRDVFTVDDYVRARRTYGATNSTGVTRQAEERAHNTGRLSPIVDPAINPIRVSTIRLDEYGLGSTNTLGGEIRIQSRSGLRRLDARWILKCNATRLDLWVAKLTRRWRFCQICTPGWRKYYMATILSFA